MHGDNIVIVEANSDKTSDAISYTGSLTHYDDLYAWAHEKSTPIVRTITFENAEVSK